MKHDPATPSFTHNAPYREVTQQLLEACGSAWELQSPQCVERKYDNLTPDQLRMLLRARDREVTMMKKLLCELREAFQREFTAKLENCVQAGSSGSPRPPRPLSRRLVPPASKEEEKEEAEDDTDWFDIYCPVSTHRSYLHTTPPGKSQSSCILQNR